MGLDTVEFVLEVEKRFDLALKDQDVETCSTLGDLHDLLLRVMGPDAPMDSTASWEELRRITAKRFSVRIETLTTDTRFVNDLGAE